MEAAEAGVRPVETEPGGEPSAVSGVPVMEEDAREGMSVKLNSPEGEDCASRT